MTEAQRIRRLELAVALIGLTAALSAAVVLLDALRFHPGPALLAAAAACFGALALAVVRVGRQAYRQRAFVRALECAGERRIDGRTVVVVRGADSAAFCAGLLRPRIYVSERTVARLGAAELRAVVAHEGHHADRRDPLRLLVTGSLRGIPAVSALRRRQAALIELAADAAAVRSLGSPAPLAGALLAFDGRVAPERVDRLLGAADAAPPARLLVAVAGAALAVVSAVGLSLVLAPHHPAYPVSSLPFGLGALALYASRAH